jgi:hypothetical protein
VISPLLLLVGAAFLTLVSFGGSVDVIAARRWPTLLWQGRNLEIIEEGLIRFGVGCYLILLWRNVGVAPWGAAQNGAILTPELLAHDRWLEWLQIATPLMLVFRRTCPIAALGLVALYADGIARYGIFHMTDYAFFLGLAGYLALSSPRFDRRADLRQWRVPLITASLGFSLMWTAIEKLLYPAWTGIVLAAHPNVTFGLPLPLVTVTASFVEFSVAFYLLVGRSLLRLDAAIVTVVLLAAIPEFGALDTAGHLPFVAALLVIIMHGPTPLQEAVHSRREGPVAAAAWTAGMYSLSFVAIMAMYYGLQKAGTWP